jgi:S1-C subfamily serine protease
MKFKILLIMLFFSFCTSSVDSEINSEDLLKESTTTTITKSEDSVLDGEIENNLLINNIEEAQKGIVRIVTQGEFSFPDDSYEIVSEIIPGSGSGFLISQDGYIVTNNHVVSGASTIEVFLNNSENSKPAQLIGKSECLDIALLKIRGDDYNYFEFNNEDVQIGTEIRSGGYPLGDKEFTLTNGIVSKVNSNSEHTWAYVQESFEHTATINPGSSGGPIFDNEFQVIGVSYAGNIYNQYFAIKSALVIDVVESLKLNQETDGLGMNFELIPEVGLYLYSTDAGGVFDNLGIKGGNIITKFGGFDLSLETSLKNFCNVLTTQTSKGSIKLEGFDVAKNSYFSGTTNSSEKINYFSDSNDVATTTTTIKQQTTTTTAFVKTYSNEVFEAWKILASDDFKYSVIGRWNKSTVNVGIIGYPTTLQFDTMKYMIGDLNRLVPNIDWTYKYATSENLLTFDIYLIFEDNSEWQDWSDAFGAGTVNPYFDDGTKKRFEDAIFYEDVDSLTKSSWYLGIGYINPDNSDPDDCQIYSIRGTMLALIGLNEQNTDSFGQNVMLGTLCTHVLTSLDEEVIKLHYDSRLGYEYNLDRLSKIIQSFIK